MFGWVCVIRSGGWIGFDVVGCVGCCCLFCWGCSVVVLVGCLVSSLWV